MDIRKQLEEDYASALRAHDDATVLTLRQLKTALTNAEIGKSREALSDDEVIKLLRSEVKKRRDAIELYERGGRPELAEKERREVAVVSRYLPPQLDEATVRAKVVEIVAQLGASGPGDTGKVTGAVMKALAGQADGSVVSKLVREALTR